MKSTFLKALFAPALIFAIFFTSCKDDDKVAVEDVEISLTFSNVNIGDYLHLEAKVLPENADNKEVRWECDETYLRNDGKGFFLALREGRTTVHVITEDGNYTDACTVIIIKPQANNNEEDNNQNLLKNINFKDTKLLNALKNNSSINLDGDDGISQYEAKLVKRLDIADKGITSFDELYYFFNLEELSCENNQIAALDLSKLTKLKTLRCQNNQLTELDLSQNSALATLLCNKNNISTLDVRGNKDLTALFCGNQTNGNLKLKLTVDQFNSVWEEDRTDIDNKNVVTVMNFFEGATIKSSKLDKELKDGDSTSFKASKITVTLSPNFAYKASKGEFTFRLFDSENNELSFYDPSVLRQIVWTSSDESVATISTEYEDAENANTAIMTVTAVAAGNTVIKGTVNDEYTISFNLEVK